MVMEEVPNNTQNKASREQLLLKCMQQILEDSTQAESINYFKKSAQSLFELFDSRKIYIFAIDEDVANKDLNVNLYLIDECHQKKADHHRIKIAQEEIKKIAFLSINECEKNDLHSSKDFKVLFNLDFSEDTSVIHPLWVGDNIVGAFCYEYSEETKPYKVITPILDVLKNLLSQRKKHIEFKEQIETYKHVLDLIPQRVFWKNKKSIYLGANAAFAADAGLSEASDIIGRDDFDCFPDEAIMYRKDDQETIQTKQHILNIEEPQTVKDGKKIWLKTSKRPMVNSQNEVIGLLGTYDEITELKNIQFELQESKDKLEYRVKERTKDLSISNHKLEATLTELKQTQKHLVETEKMAALGNLVAGISHEINTPIGVSVAAASHIEEIIEKIEKAFQSGELTEEYFSNFCSTVKNSADILMNNLDRASQLIKSFKQIAVDQTHDIPRKVILKDYLKSVLSTLSPVFKNKKIEVLFDIDNEFELVIYPGALAQVVTNLTENTLKHAFPDEETVGEIKISCYMDCTNINLSFADNGVGIPEDLQKKIFEPFFTTKGKSGGSGLGLSIIYNIVCQKFGGKIECKSELDKGTEFLMSIPIQPKTSESTE